MEFPPVQFEVTSEMVKKYSEAIRDLNPIYTDGESARKEGFAGPIARATIVCIYAIPSALLSGYKPKMIPPPGNIHYTQEYQFFSAVSPGDRINVRSVVIHKEVRKGHKYVTIETEYLNQEGKIIAVGRITPIWAK
jgi:acyl dehydratase